MAEDIPVRKPDVNTSSDFLDHQRNAKSNCYSIMPDDSNNNNKRQYTVGEFRKN